MFKLSILDLVIPISVVDQVTSPDPLTLFPVPPILIVLAVAQIVAVAALPVISDDMELGNRASAKVPALILEAF